jgi:hypothetical protein
LIFIVILNRKKGEEGKKTDSGQLEMRCFRNVFFLTPESIFKHVVGVADGASGGHPACPGKWKMCRKKKWIVVLV